VIPAYNAEATLGACLDSVLGVRYPGCEMEVIVVDNASSDGTAALLERYRGRVQVLHEKRRGPAAARNAGLRRARGDLVAFTDADCVVERAWLAELTRPLADRSVGAAGGRILPVKPYNSVEAFGTEIHDHEAAITQFKPGYVITMNWASRRAVLLEAGGFDESLLRGEDVDLAYRLVARRYRLVYVPGAVVRHRNERTLRGLFAEGWTHGYHSIEVLRKHAAFLRSLDPPESRRRRAFYWRVFGTGKLGGKLLGRLRAAAGRGRRGADRRRGAAIPDAADDRPGRAPGEPAGAVVTAGPPGAAPAQPAAGAEVPAVPRPGSAQDPPAATTRSAGGLPAASSAERPPAGSPATRSAAASG
jgi:glycosyltransferase involved in cell wall biosynthesis